MIETNSTPEAPPIERVPLSARQWGCLALAFVPIALPVILIILFRLIECAAHSFYAMINAF